MWTYNQTPNSNDVLHYGVLGMKWGVRRTEAQLARARKKAAKQEPDHDDYKKAHSGKSYRAMSNQELRDANNRLNMEKQYKDLIRKTNKGKKIVTGFIAGAATTTAVVKATKTYMKYGNFVLDKFGNWLLRDLKDFK